MDPYGQYPPTPLNGGYYPPPPPQQPATHGPRPASQVFASPPGYYTTSPPAQIYADPNLPHPGSYFPPPSPGQAYANTYTNPSASYPNVNQVADQFAAYSPYGSVPTAHTPQPSAPPTAYAPPPVINPSYPPPSPLLANAHLYPPRNNMGPPPPVQPKVARPGSTPPSMGSGRHRSATHSSTNPRASGDLHASGFPERRPSTRARGDSRPPVAPSGGAPLSRTTSSGGVPMRDRQYSSSGKPRPNVPASTTSSNTTASSSSGTGQAPTSTTSYPASISEEPVPDAIVNYWGHLLVVKGKGVPAIPSTKLVRLYEGIAKHLLDTFEPLNEGGGAVVGPRKMLGFYQRYSIKGDGMRWDEIFNQQYRGLARLYRNTRCPHHLFIPFEDLTEDPYDGHKVLPKPSMPGLTPAGFARWMTMHLLMRPNLEIARLQVLLKHEAINSADFKADKRPGDVYERFPKQIPASAFVDKECSDTRQTYGQFFGFPASPTTSSKDLQRYESESATEDSALSSEEEDDFSDDEDLPDGRPRLRKQGTIKPGQYSMGPGQIRSESIDRSTLGANGTNSRRVSGTYAYKPNKSEDLGVDPSRRHHHKSHKSHKRHDSKSSTAATSGGSPHIGVDRTAPVSIPRREARPYSYANSASQSNSAASSYNSAEGPHKDKRNTTNPDYPYPIEGSVPKSHRAGASVLSDPAYKYEQARLVNEFEETDAGWDAEIARRKHEARRLGSDAREDEDFYRVQSHPTGSSSRAHRTSRPSGGNYF